MMDLARLPHSRLPCLRDINSEIPTLTRHGNVGDSRDEFEFGRTSFGRRTTRRPRERRYASGDFEIPVRALTPRSATSRSKYRAASAVANVIVVVVVIVARRPRHEILIRGDYTRQRATFFPDARANAFERKDTRRNVGDLRNQRTAAARSLSPLPPCRCPYPSPPAVP